MRLLLVEDNDRLSEFLEKALHDSGFTVDRCASVTEAQRSTVKPLSWSAFSRNSERRSLSSTRRRRIFRTRFHWESPAVCPHTGLVRRLAPDPVLVSKLPCKPV